MIHSRTFLEERNPIIKLGLVLFLTLFISFSVFPLFPLITCIFTAAFLCFASQITPRQLLQKMKIFCTISINFMFFMLLLKGLENSSAAYQFLCFGWNKSDFWTIITLGLRIISISLLSVAFVATTDPNDLVLSMILQLGLSPVHGYAALAAYRFLPTLQQEVASIQLAQKIRGIDTGKHFIQKLTTPFQMMIPLLCSAVRKGERMAAAMESRGLSKGIQRTYYKKTQITKVDWVFLLVSVLLFLLIAAVLHRFQLFHFSFGFTLK